MFFADENRTKICHANNNNISNSSSYDNNTGINDNDNDNDYHLDDQLNEINESKDKNSFFDCLIEGCTARYRFHANLLRHYAIGRHKMHLEKYSLIDKSKMLFHKNLTTNNFRSTPLLSFTVVPPTNVVSTPPLHQGWALVKNKSHTRFTDKQKQFLQEKFNEGVKSGSEFLKKHLSIKYLFVL